MNRNNYLIGILFLGLFVIASFFDAIVYAQIDDRVYQFPSYGNWTLALLSTYAVGTVVALKYYRHKGYKFVFIAGIISLIATFVQNLDFYRAFTVTKQFSNYYIYLVIITLGSVLLYATGLMFSKAGKDRLLKVIGVLLLIGVGISSYVLVLQMNNFTGQASSRIILLAKWNAFLAALIPLPLIQLFSREMKLLKSNDGSIRKNKFPSAYVFSGIAGLLLLVLGIKLGTQPPQLMWVPNYVKALAEKFDARTRVNSDGESLLYRFREPQNYQAGEQYPLVVSLHGGAGRGSDNYKQIKGSLFARILSKSENRERYPAFILIPQCPGGSSWGGTSNPSNVAELVFETIEALEKEYPIDRDRIYVTGHSLGGYGAWHFVSQRPDMFAAAIPIAGDGNPELASKMRDVPIWAFNGASDRFVPESGSSKVIEAIQAVGGNPKYTESPDGGPSWQIVDQSPEVLDWLFAQRRQ